MILVASLLLVSAQAQDFQVRHEIAVSYGAAPITMWGNAFSDIAHSLVGTTYDNDVHIGPISAEYFYHLDEVPRLGVGGSFTYVNHAQDILFSGSKTGDRTRSYLTLMPMVKYNYVDTRNFGMYLKGGVGLTLGFDKENLNGKPTDSETKARFNFQLTLLGLEAGSQHLRGYVELGVGEQGVMLAGVRYRF